MDRCQSLAGVLFVPTSLWVLIKEKVSAHEHHEVKMLLGSSLVEQGEELHDEVQTLLEIWKDYHDETEQSAGSVSSLMPEPPDVRDRLRQEISFFVQCLEERAIENGRDPSKVMEKHNRDIISYAMDTASCSSGYNSRPSTSQSSRDSFRSATPNTDSLCHAAEIDDIADKLNIWKFDQVVASLREKLTDEITMLLKDIELIQGHLENETEVRQNHPPLEKEPTLTDLREERTSLERHLLSPEFSLNLATAEKSKPMSLRKTSSGSVKLQSLALAPPQGGVMGGASSLPPRPPVNHDHPSNNNLQLLANRPIPAPPTHITVQAPKATRSSRPNLQTAVFHASTPPTNPHASVCHVPTPPTSNKTKRIATTSASRLRKMVLECRDGT